MVMKLQISNIDKVDWFVFCNSILFQCLVQKAFCKIEDGWKDLPTHTFSSYQLARWWGFQSCKLTSKFHFLWYKICIIHNWAWAAPANHLINLIEGRICITKLFSISDFFGEQPKERGLFMFLFIGMNNDWWQYVLVSKWWFYIPVSFWSGPFTGYVSWQRGCHINLTYESNFVIWPHLVSQLSIWWVEELSK